MMNIVFTSLRLGWRLLLLSAAASLTVTASAQVPVDDDGNPIQSLDESAAITADETAGAAELMTPEELEVLVGPIALYPDDLLAIVLPASTYPLEIVQAARFLEEQAENEDLEPDESWDDSVVALLNYPEVLELMNEDIDWTWRLGEAVANQQPDVINAVEAFRDRAYAAGNLKTDEYQTVSETDEGVIEIEPVSEEVIYVPYYEPERVVVYQPRPVYYYYPRPYPVYYYPYPHGYNFYSNYFWGVTTAFSIGWATDHLHVFHHSYWGHPYYGRTYYPHWWYRRPSITIYNTWYGDRRSERSRDHYANGDFWRPRHTGGARPGFHRSRADYYRDRQRQRSSEGYRDGNGAAIARSGDRQVDRDGRVGFRGEDSARTAVRDRASGDNAIRFRERSGQPATQFTSRERASGIPDDRVDRRRTIDGERNSGDSTRGITRERQPVRQSERPTERATPRVTPPADTNRVISSDRARTQAGTTRRETVRQPVTRTPTVRAETRRQVVTPAPRDAALSRASAPRSVSRPSASSAPRSVSRPSASSAPRSVSRPSASSAPRSVSRPSASSAPRSVSSPSVSSAPRSVPRPSSSAARAPAPRPSSSGHSARRAESSSGSSRRHAPQQRR